MKVKKHKLSEALIDNGIRLSKDGEEIRLYVDDSHITSYSAELTNQQAIIDDLLSMGIDVDPAVLQKILTGQITESFRSITTQKETIMKLRALRESAARRVLAKIPSLRLIGEDDEQGLESDQYYVLVVPDDAGEIEVAFHDGELCVGPFDTPLDAAIAVGDEDADVNIVDGDGVPVGGVENDPALDPSAPLGEKTNRKPLSGMNRKKIHEQVIRDINNLLESDNQLDVDTTIGFNKDGSTQSGSGNYSGDGDPAAARQTPQDAGDSTALDTPADRRPEDRANPEGGVPLLNDPAKGGMDTNDGDLSGAGDGKGPVTVSESVNGLKRGSYVVIADQTGKRVDSGLVESVTASGVKLEGNDDAYAFNQFFVQRTR